MTIIGHASGCQCEGCEASDLRSIIDRLQAEQNEMMKAANVLHGNIARLEAELAKLRKIHGISIGENADVLQQTRAELAEARAALRARAERAESELAEAQEEE